jgi:hypothetical protein
MPKNTQQIINLLATRLKHIGSQLKSDKLRDCKRMLILGGGICFFRRTREIDIELEIHSRKDIGKSPF